jgi:hypothetical protein
VIASDTYESTNSTFSQEFTIVLAHGFRGLYPIPGRVLMMPSRFSAKQKAGPILSNQELPSFSRRVCPEAALGVDSRLTRS